jgi:ATP-binding cassette subfamily C protein CydCD
MHRRLISLTRNSRLALTLTILTGFLAGILTIGQAWYLSLVIDGVFLGSRSLIQVLPWLRLLLFILSGRAFLAWINEVSANAIAVRIKTDLRERLFTHLLNLGPSFSRGERTGELTATVVEGVEALDSYFSQYLPQLVVSTLVPLSILVFVFPLDPLSGLVLLLTAPLIPLFMYLIGKGAEIVTQRQYETLGRLSAHFLDSLQGLTTLKLFGQSKAHTRSIAQVSQQFRDTTMSVLRVTFLSALALELIATLSTAIVAVEIGLRLLYGRMDFQEALFLLVLAPEFYLPLRMLGLRFHAGMAGTSAARRIFEILDTPTSNRASISQALKPKSTFARIEFSGVAFTYPNETAPALQNINLQIRSGQHLALVGRSGAGKSTLANLLLRFIQPQEGQISIDGEPLEQFPLEDWRRLIAWVPQRPYLFHDTIAANLRLGQPDADMQELIEAAQMANLHDFILSLPQGYLTVIGEGGGRLSGGQAQRLALARAFLKNTPLLILDEPTSSLDPENEALLEAATRRLRQGRTVITIAHRLNTVYQADQIIVLDNSRITEQGMHANLLAQKGAYAKMVNALKVKSVELPFQTPAKHNALPALDLQLSAQPVPFVRHAPRIMPRLLSFLKGSWGMVLLSVLLGTLTIGSNIALMGTSAWLISAAALHPSIADLEIAIVGVRFFGISRGVFRYLERLTSHDVTFRLLARLRIWFYEKLEPLAPARLLEYRSGDLLSRVTSDVEMLENFYVRVVAPPLVAVAVALGTVWLLGSFASQLALVLLSFLLGMGLFLPILIQWLSRTSASDLVNDRAQMQVQLVDGVQGMADLLIFGGGTSQLREIVNTGKNYAKSEKRLSLIGGFNAALIVLLPNLGMLAVIVLAIPLVIAGRIQGVVLATLALVTLTSFEAVNPLPLAAQMWMSTREAARRLFDVVDARPAVSDPPLPLTTPRSGALSVRDLSFTYRESGPPALDGLSFDLPSGKRLAIVGPSGAGKSTLINLLLRFWEYRQGEILLDGEPLDAYAQSDVRLMIGTVSQNSYFFNATIGQNLKLAQPKASIKQLERATRQAQIYEFIRHLPQGFETIIGEQGLRLSGGERQRLAIARALLKDSPILILDEPTANLDPVTEKRVLDTLFDLMHGRTALLVTHRLVGLESMDEILVLDHGQVVERGVHAQLLKQGGLYRRMWELQNRILEQ